jgi:arylsulfatase
MGRIGASARSLSLAAAAALAGCRAPEPPPVALDLALAAPAADFRGRWDLLLAGTPASMLRLKGASAEPALAGDARVLLRRRPFVVLQWKGLAPRLAVVDLEPVVPEAPTPATVRLNDLEIGRLVPLAGRRRYLLTLPVEAQRRRQNLLRLDFDGADAAPAAKDREPPAMARLYAVAVGPEADPALRDLASPLAPPPLSRASEGGRPVLVQAVPGSIRYALRVPEGAELRFAAGLHPAARAAGARADLRVTLEERDGLESEVWSGSASSTSAAAEVRLPIPVRPGAIIRLALHASGARFPWVVWSAPRLLGRGPADPLAAHPLAAAEHARGDALRRALAGSSVLLLILDAAGARHFSCYGYERPTTPEIDRLAAEGVLFEQAYTTAAYTRSAMASLWTSRYHDQHHAGLRYDAALPDGSPTLARLLARHGIRTAGFVGNPSAGRPFGLDQGFAEFQAVYGRAAVGGPASRADALREAATAWLAERRAGGRFFAYLHFREPHSPFDPPPPFDTRFGPDAPLAREARSGAWTRAVNDGRREVTREELDHLVRLYDGNLAWVDSQLGALRRALEALGLWESLVVIVSADHGEAFQEHGFIGHNKQLYQETARIPLVVRFPKGKGPAGARVRELVDLVDLAPTIADVFGVATTAAGQPDPGYLGRSLLAVASGAPGKPGTLARTAHEEGLYAVTDGRFKLIHSIGSGRDELYDLEADPGETRDLAGERRVHVDYYRQALHRWLMSVAPGRPAGAPRALSPEELESLRALGYVN